MFILVILEGGLDGSTTAHEPWRHGMMPSAQMKSGCLTTALENNGSVTGTRLRAASDLDVRMPKLATRITFGA
jgi:hypothetical protein